MKTTTKKLKHDVYLVKKLQIRDLALVSGLCHVAKERYCEPHGLFTWSEVQNVLQNMPLQKFCKIFAKFFT